MTPCPHGQEYECTECLKDKTLLLNEDKKKDVALTPEDIALRWGYTIELRKTVLEWAKITGFEVSQLVSRTAEHDLEKLYGRMLLNAKPIKRRDGFSD